MIAMEKRLASALGMTCAISLGLLAITQSASAQIIESQSNNTFTTRESLPMGTTLIHGVIGLDQITFDSTFSDSLSPGEVDIFTIPGLIPSGHFFAQTDNTASHIDTILGAFDENGMLIAFNDDSGTGATSGLNSTASALNGVVNANGTIDVRVTGYPDSTFKGDHSESGTYGLFVLTGDRVVGDVDIFAFSHLLAGSPFTAEISSGNFDSILGWFDDSGNLIDINDDGNGFLLSLMKGMVPESGNLILAVSGYADFGFRGDHSERSTYTLSLQATAVPDHSPPVPQSVPEPTTILGLLTFGILGAGAKRKHHPNP